MKFFDSLSGSFIEEVGDLVELIGTGLIIFSVIETGFGTIIGESIAATKVEIPILGEIAVFVFLLGLAIKFLGRVWLKFTTLNLFTFLTSLLLLGLFLHKVTLKMIITDIPMLSIGTR